MGDACADAVPRCTRLVPSGSASCTQQSNDDAISPLAVSLLSKEAPVAPAHPAHDALNPCTGRRVCRAVGGRGVMNCRRSQRLRLTRARGKLHCLAELETSMLYPCDLRRLPIKHAANKEVHWTWGRGMPVAQMYQSSECDQIGPRRADVPGASTRSGRGEDVWGPLCAAQTGQHRGCEVKHEHSSWEERSYGVKPCRRRRKTAAASPLTATRAPGESHGTCSTTRPHLLRRSRACIGSSGQCRILPH